MKLQITEASLRLRVSEAELDALQRGHALRLAPAWAGGELMHLEVAAGEHSAFDAGAVWRLTIAREALEAYAASLPRRDALVVLPEQGAGMRVDFEVDVRDSIATRGAARRPAARLGPSD